MEVIAIRLKTAFKLDRNRIRGSVAYVGMGTHRPFWARNEVLRRQAGRSREKVAEVVSLKGLEAANGPRNHGFWISPEVRGPQLLRGKRTQLPL